MNPLRRLAAVAVALLALVCASLSAQQTFFLVPSTTAATTNGTTTKNTVTFTGGSTSSGMFLLNVTAGGAATGTLQLFIEDSFDGGATFNDLAAFAPFTFGAAATTQTLALNGYQDGPGLLRTITGATPAAGAEITETVPVGARWLFQSARFQLVCSATVANRLVAVTLDDGAALYAAVGGTALQPASSTFIYTFGSGMSTPGVGTQPTNALSFSLPTPLFLPGGHRWRTQTGSIQVGDQYSAIVYSVREWRDLPNRAQATETFPAGQVRSGPWGDRVRIREVITNIAGSPTGPTYSVSSVMRS